MKRNILRASAILFFTGLLSSCVVYGPPRPRHYPPPPYHHHHHRHRVIIFGSNAAPATFLPDTFAVLPADTTNIFLY